MLGHFPPEPKVKSLTEAQKALQPVYEEENSSILAFVDGDWRAATVLKVTYAPLCFVSTQSWKQMTAAEKDYTSGTSSSRAARSR